MPKRFVAIWFLSLKTDWFLLRNPGLKDKAFVLAAHDHGRMVITAANSIARSQGIDKGMVLADARAILPSLEYFDDQPQKFSRLLESIGAWCIRYTPMVALDMPDGLILESTGCAHLWGNEAAYLDAIANRFNQFGYHVRLCMADTIGAAWALVHFGEIKTIVQPHEQLKALMNLSPSALRIDPEILERLHKLGLRKISHIVAMPRSALRRRFGTGFIRQLDFALGNENEPILPILPPVPFQERLSSLDPILTLTGIEIALQTLLDNLCLRLYQCGKGLRFASFTCFRVDGKVVKIDIGTNRASHQSKHLFKLFELKLNSIEPGLGIELFQLDGSRVEEINPVQEKIWETTGGLDDDGVFELIDRVTNKMGANCIQRFGPDEHYWPERSFKPMDSLQEKIVSSWKSDRPRPVHLLARPEPIQVMAPIPDYPPMLFRYKNKLHKIKKADGPERIEREWWIEEGDHRDYYQVEDEDGIRYWLFRSGHYSDKNYQWFIHGFFA
jgi:protein ImuB